MLQFLGPPPRISIGLQDLRPSAGHLPPPGLELGVMVKIVFFAWLTWVLPHEIHSLMVVKIGFMVVNISCSPSFWGMNILLPDFFMFSRVPGVLSIAKDGCGIFSTFTGDSFAFMRCSGGSFASVEYLGSTLYLFIWCPLFDLGYKKRWKNLRGRDL